MLSVNQIRADIETKIMVVIQPDPNIFLVPQNTDIQYDLNTDDDVICKVTVNFGETLQGEKGYEGVSRRICLLAINLYCLWGTGTGRILDVCKIFEDAFRRLEMTSASGDQILFGDSYTDGGFLTETTKFCYVVKVPFWAWVGN